MLIAQDGLANPGDTGGNGVASVPFQSGNVWSGATHPRHQLFMRKNSICSGIVGQRNAAYLRRTPHCDGRIPMLTDDTDMHGARFDLQLCAEKGTEPFRIKQGAGPDDPTDRQADSD